MMMEAWRLIRGKRWLAPLLLLVFSRASSQEPAARLTVEQALAAAITNNRELKLATLDEKIASARYKETQAVFLPQAGVSYSAMTTNNPLNAFGFKLQQQTITSGDFNPEQLNHPGGTPDFMARADVQQPLVNMDQLYLRKSAGKEVEVYRFKAQRTREGLVFEVSKAYMQLQLADASVKVLEEALATANALYRYTSDRVGQGLLNKADDLNAKVQVTTTESRLAEAKSQVKNAADYLSLLMGSPYGTLYVVDSNQVQEIGPLLTDPVVPASRADFAALQKAIDASDLGIRSRKMSAMPRLNAFGSYQFNDSRMFGFGANAYLAGVQLSWDIFKGNSIRNKIATQTLERNKLAEELSLRKDQSNLELNKAQRQLADAGYRIRQQQAASAGAAEALRILQDRYQQGLAGSTDVLLAQTQLSQQQLALAQAVFDHQVTLAYIQFLTTSSGR
ncbi:MAG TPA: TolC family protein [Puia sp.]|nr:TolC family protein [Puia sp.]